jgi:hypothetical protein
VCAFQWLSANRLALAAKQSIPSDPWIHLRYEDIFERPVEMFQKTFDQLRIPFDQTVRERCANLQPTSVVKGTPKLQKWKERNPDAIRRILPRIRPLMLELGYDPDQ